MWRPALFQKIKKRIVRAVHCLWLMRHIYSQQLLPAGATLDGYCFGAASISIFARAIAAMRPGAANQSVEQHKVHSAIFFHGRTQVRTN
jgi:hypothetical protein